MGLGAMVGAVERPCWQPMVQPVVGELEAWQVGYWLVGHLLRDPPGPHRAT